MNEVWFTADTHFGHGRLIELMPRPFSSVEEMDEELIRRWNTLVGRGDTVYHLGDFSFHKLDKTAEIIGRLNGQIHLVLGNHDHKRVASKLSSRFAWVGNYKEIRVSGQKICMLHFPMMVWNQSHFGSWHLHGHSHGSLPVDKRALRVDVGSDAWSYAPVSFDEIAAEMRTREFAPIDHHGR